MLKLSVFLIGVLSVFVVCGMFQISVYQQLVNRLEWSSQTEHLNVIANRNLYRQCRNK